jgi:drug/metabolite transporter (DMT)-like permease
MIGGAIFFRSLAAVAAKAAAAAGETLTSSILNLWYGGLLAFLFLQALCWTAALRRVPLTVAYPFMSLVFALNLAAARWIFAERVAPAHVWGVVLVMTGVSLVSRESSSA